MRKKKLLIAAGVVLVGCVGAFAFFSTQKPAPPQVSTTELKQTTLRSTVDASGLVESTDEIKVYAEVTAPIDSVAVKVGDRVAAGDLLCELDATDLRDTLEQKEIALRTGSQSSAQRIASAQKQYENDKGTLESGLNTQVNAAKDQVASAQRALDDAKQQQADAQKRIDQDLNSTMISLNSQLEVAKTALDRAKSAYNTRRDEEGDRYKELKKDVKDQEDLVKARKKVLDQLKAQQLKSPTDPSIAAEIANATARVQEAEETLTEYKKALEDYEADDEGYDASDPTRQSLKQLRQAMEDAQQNYDTAQKNLTAAQNSVTEEMSQYVRAVESAQTTYDNAVRSQKSAETAASQALDTAKDSIESEKLAANTEAQRAEISTLQENIEKCRVTAPAAGTITAVYAEENATVQGLLFIIENTDALQVTVKVKEYDVTSIKEGMKAVITADATGDAEYEGVVQKIAPAAAKSQDGQAATGSDVEFDTEVLVTTADTQLRVGMNAKAKIILEEKADTLAVAYDVLVDDGKGGQEIYTTEKQADGTYTVKAIPVTTGIETDFEVEVSGDGVSAGLPVIADGKSVKVGQTVALAGDTSSSGPESSSVLFGGGA